MVSRYIIHNDKIFLYDEFKIGFDNRAFKYGDGIFETIRICNGKAVNFEYHFDRIEKSAKILNLVFNFEIESFYKKIDILIDKSKINYGGIAKLYIYRSGLQNSYMPQGNKAEYIIELRDYSYNEIAINETNVCNIGIYDSIKKPVNILSNLKTLNSLIYIMASHYAQNNKYDDCLIINENNEIIESTNSNIFLYHNNKVYTPSLNSGCVDGIMRRKIIDILLEDEIEIYETKVTLDKILAADEIFLTNAVNGAKAVTGYDNKRYSKNFSRFLNIRLNQSLINNN